MNDSHATANDLDRMYRDGHLGPVLSQIELGPNRLSRAGRV
jgi:hypothetical protein